MEIEILEKKRKIPDFMIVGAMKCGTTSLHYSLANHPQIFIPEPEIHFYDMDNYFQHKDSFTYHNNTWYYPNFNQNISKSFDWYESWFQNAPKNHFIGEDSTIYLASTIAHKRIAQFSPNTKIIVMLRDPASRAYSQYCHLVLTGRLTCNFEEAISQGLGNILDRSLYQQQIESFLQFLPRKNFHFILFEEFIKNTDDIIKKVLNFLEIPFNNFDIFSISQYKNKSLVPKNMTIQRLRNSLIKETNNIKYGQFYSKLTNLPLEDYKNKNTFYRLINKINRLINPLENKKFPEMKLETRKFLNTYLKEQNQGLDKIINKNIEYFWYK